MKKLFIFALILIGSYSASKAQGYFQLHVGPSFPLSDFADDNMDNDHSGGAGIGFNLGGKYLYQINTNGLGLFIGADFNYNGLKSSVKDDLENSFGSSGNIDIKYYKYINVPLLAGLNYTVYANEQIAGPDFLKMTNMTVEADNEKVELNFKLSTQLGYKIGGGLLINDKYVVGLDYLGLGGHSIKGEMQYNGDTQDLDNLKQKVSLLTLTFGIKL
jgi:hypothetical protein